MSSIIKKFKTSLFAIFLFFGIISPVFSNTALAASTDNTATTTDMEKVLCNAYSIFNGNIGKTFAVFAIVSLGVGFFLGKVSWGTAIAIALGIGAIFGAPQLVKTLSGGDVVCQGKTDATTAD